jgi:hypothetical protein
MTATEVKSKLPEWAKVEITGAGFLWLGATAINVSRITEVDVRDDEVVIHTKESMHFLPKEGVVHTLVY